MPFGNMGGMTLVVILFIVLLLFGAPKLPGLARSIGQSMKILKKEVSSDAPADAKAEEPVVDEVSLAKAEAEAARAEAAAAKAEIEALKRDANQQG